MSVPQWQWDEMQQVGTDFADPREVAAYDERMATFRDVDAENRRRLEMLDLPPGAALLDVGSGTGAFARAAARAGVRVCAVDVSAAMLTYLAERAAAEGLRGITTQHAGFLTMDFPPAGFDAVVSWAALHHLPDAWKLVALRRIARVLRPGGQLLLGDVVFSPAPGEAPESCFERFVASVPTMRDGAVGHVAREFSTYDWILEGLLERAGFEILSWQPSPAGSFLVCLARRK